MKTKLEKTIDEIKFEIKTQAGFIEVVEVDQLLDKLISARLIK